MHALQIVALRPWPCGCVHDAQVLQPRSSWHIAYECSWCGAVISRADLISWFCEADLLPPFLIDVSQLLRVGQEIFTMEGMCPDGHPIVKARAVGAQCKHLPLPMSAVEVLRD